MASKILVADDSSTIRKIVAMAFENEDESVEGVSSGNEALEKISTFAPDIVLADIEMPELNGFALSHKIKSDPDLKHIKVLLLASDFEDFNQDKFEECLADDHISKPFKSDDVINKIRELLAGESSADADETKAIELSEAAIINPPPEDDVIALSAEDAIEETEEAFELSADSIINDEAEDDGEGAITLNADDEINPDETAETLVDEAETPEEPATTAAIPDEPETPPAPVSSEPAEEAVEPPEPAMDESAEASEETPLDAPSPRKEISFDQMLDEMFELDAPSESPASQAVEAESAPPEIIEAPEPDPPVNEPEPEPVAETPTIETPEPEAPEPVAEAPSMEVNPEDENAATQKSQKVIAEMLKESETLKNMDRHEKATEKSSSAITGSRMFPLPDFGEDLSERNAYNGMDNDSELDQAFAEMKRLPKPVKTVEPEKKTKAMNDSNDFDDIIAEPEDLLETMAPSAFSSSKGGPDLIQESLDNLSRQPNPTASYSLDAPRPRNPFRVDEDPFVKIVGERIKGVLENSLDSSIEKEIDGLSETIVESVREIVREITPHIAKAVIREEIERIKQMDDF
ncbi:MAG: response regulator [Candidatus Nitrohelix vancouverensis]|uniref:Response regulator n=1 Tax=Candidatus Nitrohelix vancouverensis TaxID=2705534 RepID=A0A7T0BZS3_9BACT|nr:MAG: response regulator [Candidatus Nitrohelix vancouverensis]